MFRPCIVMACLLGLACAVLPAAGSEVQYPGEAFAKLDTFEAIAVEDADKLFNKKDYPGAYAAYKAYSIEFADGRALPYVLLRMGRCLHLAGKRNTAIKAYQDVVDYFPDDVRYAAAALFYIGQCHAQNGNTDKSLAVWAKMVKDKAYVAEPNSGTALTELANAMQKRGDYGEAATYQWRTAVAFRQTNRQAAEQARRDVVYHYAVRSPSQDKLLAFCNEVGGFGWRHKIDKPEDDAHYWKHVLDVVLRADVDQEKKSDACRYWDGQLGDRFVENDALRVTWFNTRLAHDKDAKAWAERMDAQFQSQPTTIKRVRTFLSYYGRSPEARSAFFAKHGKPLVSGLDTKEKLSLIAHLRNNPHRMHDEAAEVLLAVRTDEMDDPTLSTYANYVADYQGEDAFLRAVAKIKDKAFAARTRFDWYFRRDPRRNKDMREKALAEVPVLSKSPDHAQAIAWRHAELVEWQGEFEQAIKLFTATKIEPGASWAEIRCRLAMKQHAKAIQICKDLEGIPSEAAKACFKAAEIYRTMGDKAKEVQQLQLVLRRYPKSRESSDAHGRLESYGVKLIGGESEAEE